MLWWLHQSSRKPTTLVVGSSLGKDVYFTQMILVTKDEAIILRQKIPEVSITRTMKQKSKRHHYYCEETLNAFSVLKELRKVNYIHIN